MRRRAAWTLAGLGLAAWLPPAATAQGIAIDEFTTPQAASVGTGGVGVATSAVAAPEAIGGERDFEVVRTGGNGAASASADAGEAGALIFDSGAGTQATLLVAWDGADGSASELDPSGLGGIDLSDGGTLGAFDLVGGADLTAVLLLRVYDAGDATGATWSEAQIEIPGSGGKVEFSSVAAPFAAFVASGPLGPASFANAGAITLAVEGPAGLDFSLASIQVPEPAAAALAAIAALAALARARRSGP